MKRRRITRSLFGEILDRLLAPLLLLWPLSVVLTWVVAQGIANQPFDRDLAAKAKLLGRDVLQQAGAGGNGVAAFLVSPRAAEVLRPDDEDALWFQVRGSAGEVLAGEGSLPAPSADDAAPGEVRYRDATIGAQKVRVASMSVAAGPGERSRGFAPLIQVAETLNKRERLATEIIKGVILPQFVILPIAVLLVWLGLARGIEPLSTLQQRLRRRASADLSPIDEHEVPEEMAPLVRAVNDLLSRLDESLRAQKHFLADAAHQLKTPLAGLRTQAELAARDIEAGRHDPTAMRESLRQIARSSQRAAHMVNQLLAMARTEHEEPGADEAPIDLALLARDTVREFVPRALERQIDLGLETLPADDPDPVGTTIRGNPLLLREMLANLVDNALHYTPRGGSVTVRVVADPFGQVAVLQVEDSGPGIAVAEREQIFRPFYRSLGTGVDGSGLGLAIVREIALRHRADVTLSDAEPRRRDAASAGAGPGALFTVRFTTPAGVVSA